jgi:hypothetical protein
MILTFHPSPPKPTLTRMTLTQIMHPNVPNRLPPRTPLPLLTQSEQHAPNQIPTSPIMMTNPPTANLLPNSQHIPVLQNLLHLLCMITPPMGLPRMYPNNQPQILPILSCPPPALTGLKPAQMISAKSSTTTSQDLTTSKPKLTVS